MMQYVAVYPVDWCGVELAVGDTFSVEDGGEATVELLLMAGKVRPVPGSPVKPIMSTQEEIPPEPMAEDEGFANKRRR